MRSVVGFWISTFLNSVNNAENISVSISPEKKMPAQNLIPVILGIIIVPLVWMICFFAETAANTGQEKAVFHLRITFVRDVKKNAKHLALWSRLDATPQGA
ncbi:MAG: hypothetical protein COS40_11500 [Deltaproteobacteria bacterium CG03_land_8_20_14_0_80_45_14]|nr:MAG: hypothetical protein COS40_11500 [Deltaproteobacteria bacterium CG03_land_8_20_14_0_80_45_14]